MTRHEVEVEREIEEVKTVTDQETFYICDACTAEIDADDVFVFYNRHSEIESVDLCEDCVANPSKSLRRADIGIRGDQSEQEHSTNKAGALLLGMLGVMFLSGLVFGMFVV